MGSRRYHQTRCRFCDNVFTPIRATNYFCSGVCRGQHLTLKTHPNLNLSYFSHLSNKQVAYWLGFCCADGTVGTYNNSTQFRLAISVKDEHWLDRFITDVGANPNKKVYTPKNNSSLVAIQIRNKEFVNHLISAGCTPNKTKTLRFPALPTIESKLSFLLGFFDGDGTISGKHVYSAVLTCASYDFLNDIKRTFSIDYQIRTHGATTHQWRLTLGSRLYRAMLANFEYSLPRKRLNYKYNLPLWTECA